MEEKQTQSPHLFPSAFYTESLETWVDALQGASSEAEQCLLEQVVHYKARSRMEHEFLIVHASHPSGRKIVLGVDRDKAGAFSASMNRKTSPSPPSSSKPAVDLVWVSNDGTPKPILDYLGPYVLLSTISFPPSSDAARKQERPRPSLLDLSDILLAIHIHFPSYALLKHQCYFFARETCVALICLYHGVETVHSEGRAETWCGVRVSHWLAASVAVPTFFVAFGAALCLPTFALSILIGLLTAYIAVDFCKKHDVQRALDRLRIQLTSCSRSSDLARRLTLALTAFVRA